MTINQSTSKEGEALLVQFSNPWLLVQKILSCKFSIIIEKEVEKEAEKVEWIKVSDKETEDLYYYKEFRWSIDGFSFTDFIWCGDNYVNLLNLQPPKDKLFFLQLRLTQIGELEKHRLTAETLDLQILQNNNEFCVNDQVTCCDANSIVQGFVFNNCCGETFNPYNLGNTNVLYQQLCGVISNMFGFCVGYYKVDPDQKSRDVILKEYSLYNVSQYDTVKILIPDNQLPSRDIQYNPLMLDFPAQFEVHIVKSSFEQVFGKGARPMQHDYLYFEQYMNRVYEVDAVAQPDDVIFGSAYWRVSLVPYQKRTAVGYDNAEDLKIQTEDIVSSIEDVFKEEREIEYDDTRKPNQYKTIGTLSDDYVRTYLHKQLKIEPISVHNGYTVISKYCYDLRSIPANDLAVKYREGTAFQKSQYGYVNGAISFFINLQTKPAPKTILKFKEGNGYFITADIPLDKMEKLRYESLQKYDYLKIDRRLYCIKNVETKNNQIIVELTTNLHAELKDFVAIKQIQKTDVLVYDDNFKVSVSGKSIEIEYNGKSYTSNFAFENDNWYIFVINYNELAHQFSIFVYQEKDNKLQKVYKNTWNDATISEDTTGEWKLYGSECKFTNFRVWKAPIEEDEQLSVLQQYVVNDTHLTTLVDNATPELLLQKTK